MVRKPSAMFSRGGRNGKTVDILFVLEEPASDGRIVTRERQVKKVETSSTTYSRLKDMARFHLQITGAIELWRLEDGCPNTMNLGSTEPISKAIVKDSKLQVEKLGFHDDVYGVVGTHSASILAIGDSDEKMHCVAGFPSDVIDIGDSIIPVATPIAYYPSDRVSSSADERSDAEIARALSMELNGLTSASQASKKPSKIFNFASPPRPKPALGKLVAKASCSQFSIDGGRSACTSICLYAAAQLLSRINETPGCITTSALDGYLEFGTTLYQNEHLYGLQEDHTSVDDLWNQPCFAEVVRGLVRCSPISGITSQSSFEDGLMTAMSYAHSRNEQSVALVVTKPPETILMVCKDVHRSAPWFLFDSHGRDYDFPKKAYVTQLGSVETAAAALLRKFPSVKGLGSSLHAQQMNMYEAHPIILRDTMADKETSDLETALALSTPPDDPDKAPWDEFKRGSNECNDFNTTESFLQDCFPENLTGCCKPPHIEQNKSPIEDADLLLTSSSQEKEKFSPTTNSNVSSAHQATDKPSCHVASSESKSCASTFSKPKGGSASAIGSTMSLLEHQSTTRPSLPLLSSEATPRDAKVPSSTPATNDNVHQTRPSNPFLQDAERQSPSPSFDSTSRAATTPSCIPVTRSSAKHTASTPGLQDTDIVRDPITGMLFADPVFCDKGHTHERSSIESHFRARREMKAEEEERVQQEAGGASSREDSCGAGSNFDPTCPLTSEPISEILIINDNLDRMIPMLVESGVIPLEDGELEDWRERREEKTRLARERRTQIAAARQEESPHEAHQEEPRPPAAPMADSTTVRIQRPLRRCNPAGHTDLGVSVALCPSDWKESAKIRIPIPRCSIGCCRSRLRKSNRGTCARCTQIVCSNCLVFHVGDTNQNNGSAKNHLICPECVLQISNTLAVGVDPESNSEESQLVKELDTVMTRFFTSLRERTSVVQHQVTQFNKHQSFVTFAERLSIQIVELEQTRDTLGNQIRQAREQAEAAKHDEVSATEVAANSPTPEEMSLQTKVSDLQAKYDEIDWTDEEGMIEGSLVEYQLNEAMGELAVARSSRPSASSSATGAAGASAKQTSELEAKFAAVQTKYDALLAKGPSNGHDHKYAIKITQLADELEKLSTEVIQARETTPAVRARKSDSSSSSKSTRNSNGDANSRVKLGNIASSLASFIAMPFSSSKSSATVSSSKDAPTPTNLTDDAISNIPAPVLNAASVTIAASDLAAIGVIGIEEVSELPLNLHYPSARLRNQVLVLRNELELAQLESERSLDEEYANHRSQLQTRVERLEDELVTMRREVANAQASAAEEERLQRERVARREAAERERQRIERERAAEAARLRREKERLETARRQQERETRKALRGLDLRKCGNPKCGFGPFEKFNCNDMGAHNDTFFYIDSNGRRQQRRRNECPQCRWTNSDWKQWPKFNA